MRILVAGGRNFTNRGVVFDALNELHAVAPITVIIHGACHTPCNADKLAGEWASTNGIAEEVYPVSTSIDGPWPAAGHRRNARMFKLSYPDGGVFFPGGNGTKGMKDILVRANLPTWEPCKI